jgi:hypothetical protein
VSDSLLLERMSKMAIEATDPVASPKSCLLRMAIFLAAAGLVALVLRRELESAFLANPVLDASILAVLMLGIVLALRQVLALRPEARWANAAVSGTLEGQAAPRLLAPLAAFLGVNPFSTPVAATGLRPVLDSVGSRLDEARELTRYLAGLMIFLGLLGTFWGLVATIAAVGETIGSMQAGTDPTRLVETMKSGLSVPLSDMSLAFSSSLFGLAGALVLGFFDLQAGFAQDRFLAELEMAMMGAAARSSGPLPGLDGLPPDLRATLEKIASSADHSHARATMVAVADLADGVQRLVGQMRAEQALIREWVEVHAAEGREIRAVLDRIAEREKEPAE